MRGKSARERSSAPPFRERILKILLLEDDFEYGSSVSEYLGSLGYEIDLCANGDEACDKIAKGIYHLLVLDIKVPGTSGIEVLKYARSLNLQTPVMMMTSLGDIEDLSVCYELGCNEYLKKPFHLAELKFRVSELMKKYFGDEKDAVKIADKFYYFSNSKTLKFGKDIVNLSAKEVKIIEFLLANIKNFVSVDDIIENVWEKEALSVDVRVHISNLRAKTSSDFIISSRGFGYKINA